MPEKKAHILIIEAWLPRVISMHADVKFFEERWLDDGHQKPGDDRTPYQRDRARIMHSAAFRRLQGKTQVMGVGEGDFHRTRLTHSIEVAQIGCGILRVIENRLGDNLEGIRDWLPSSDLVEAACLAHDLGHPPFGHKGEQALHAAMVSNGGFEGNGQTLRILSKLEKYKARGNGIFPTRRLVLAVLKYPCAMDSFDLSGHQFKPPKCYLSEEKDVVRWALSGFLDKDSKAFQALNKNKPQYHTFDCSILELADDIAYGVHDLEDIVARGLVSRFDLDSALRSAFQKVDGKIDYAGGLIDGSSVFKRLTGDSFSRKQQISDLVHLFISNVKVEEVTACSFDHPMLRYNAVLPCAHRTLLSALKEMAFSLVIKHAKIQQLERRGGMVVSRLYEALISGPEELIPKSSWEDGCVDCSNERRVCDYIAGMTDNYAEKLYKRLFIPGYGSSNDEL